MEIFDKITDAEKQAMEWYIKSYAGEANADRASLSHVMREWDKEKSSYLYKLLGNSLKVSKDIEIEMDHDELVREIDKRMNDFDSSFYNFYRNVREFDSEYYHKHRNRYDIEMLFDMDCLIANKYTGPDFCMVKPDGKTVQIHNGCKAVKTLCDLAKIFDIKGAEEFRLDYSRIMNKKKYKGKLTLSIHPLDFMTMSDNQSDWESCMSWINEGCYRQGTVEMMNSEGVLVAYLESKTPMTIYDGFNWDNKKWRELFIVTKDNINAVKGYPYQSKQLASYVIEWIAELAKKNLAWDYCSGVIAYNYNDDGFKYNGKEYHFTFVTNNMYNDFESLDENYCKLSMDLVNSDDTYNSITYAYSGASECMWCGELDPQLDDESNLICNECYQREHCYLCGNVMDEDDKYELDGNYYCEDCYNEHAVECIDGEMHDYDNCFKVYLARARKDSDEDVHIDEYDDQYVWVYEDRWWREHGMEEYFSGFERDNNGNAYYHTVTQSSRWWRETYNYIYPEECNDNGLEAFGISPQRMTDYIDGNC